MLRFNRVLIQRNFIGFFAKRKRAQCFCSGKCAGILRRAEVLKGFPAHQEELSGTVLRDKL